MAENLENEYKVCQKCGRVFGPGINQCHNCGTSDFRPMTKEEKDSSRERIFFQLDPTTQKITEAIGAGIFYL